MVNEELSSLPFVAFPGVALTLRDLYHEEKDEQRKRIVREVPEMGAEYTRALVATVAVAILSSFNVGFSLVLTQNPL